MVEFEKGLVEVGDGVHAYLQPYGSWGWSNAGLVVSRQESRFIFYSADFTAMNQLLAFLTENCCAADCGPPCTPMQSCKPDQPSRARRGAAPTSKGVKA